MATPSLDNPQQSGSENGPINQSATVRPAAFRVAHADGREGILNAPHELYFFVPDEWRAPIPPDQEDARQELEHFSSILRLALVHDQMALDSYFTKLVTLAQGAFNSGGFRPESLSTLETMKDEVVRLVGPRLQHEYLRRLRNAVLVASCLILGIAIGLNWFVKQGVSSGHIVATAGGGIPDAAAVKDEKQGQGPKVDTEIKQFLLGNHVRWDGHFSILHIGLLLAFSMVGLLFASMMRNLVPTFDNLLTPDADLMYPWIKLTFYGIAIFIMGTLFEEQWITVSLGERFSTAAINENAIAAVIFGLFLGIAERLVPREVVRYATEVVMRSSSRQP